MGSIIRLLLSIVYQSVARNNYKAGECLPLEAPFGCLVQLEEVKTLKDVFDVPQYLQVYFAFSPPS